MFLSTSRAWRPSRAKTKGSEIECIPSCRKSFPTISYSQHPRAWAVAFMSRDGRIMFHGVPTNPRVKKKTNGSREIAGPCRQWDIHVLMKHDNRRKGMSDRMAWCAASPATPAMQVTERWQPERTLREKATTGSSHLIAKIGDRKIRIIDTNDYLDGDSSQLCLFTHFEKPLLYPTEYILSLPSLLSDLTIGRWEITARAKE